MIRSKPTKLRDLPSTSFITQPFHLFGPLSAFRLQKELSFGCASKISQTDLLSDFDSALNLDVASSHGKL